MKTESIEETLGAWQQRCKAQGLTLTASRQAILRALVEQEVARDAVPLLQAAQRHYADVSIGTVYRFLRELERRGLIQAQLQPHARTLWRLRKDATFNATQSTGDVHRMLATVQDFLRTLEHMGLAESVGASKVGADKYTHYSAPHSDRTFAVLNDIAERFGYRLLPVQRHSV